MPIHEVYAHLCVKNAAHAITFMLLKAACGKWAIAPALRLSLLTQRPTSMCGRNATIGSYKISLPYEAMSPKRLLMLWR